jgi:hypothetical protein
VRRRNDAFFEQTRDWPTDQLGRFIARCGEHLQLRDDRNGRARSRALAEAMPALKPLTVWPGDSLHEEVERAVSGWAEKDPDRLLAACRWAARSLSPEHLEAVLDLLLDIRFAHGEILAFALIDGAAAAAPAIRTQLVNLAGLEKGAASALALAERLRFAGWDDVAAYEAVGRVAANLNPSRLPLTLSAIDASWSRLGKDTADARAYLRDLETRVGESVLLQCLVELRLPATSTMLRAAFAPSRERALFAVSMSGDQLKFQGETVSVGVLVRPALDAFLRTLEQRVPHEAVTPNQPLTRGIYLRFIEPSGA